MNRLLSLSQLPDAVVAVKDFHVLGAMQALKEASMHIPADVAVIGFANEPFSKYTTQALSTVDQKATRMGEEAAKLFFNLPEKTASTINLLPKLYLNPR